MTPGPMFGPMEDSPRTHLEHMLQFSKVPHQLCPQLPMVVCIESFSGGWTFYVPSNLQRSLACNNLKNWAFGKATIARQWFLVNCLKKEKSHVYSCLFAWWNFWSIWPFLKVHFQFHANPKPSRCEGTTGVSEGNGATLIATTFGSHNQTAFRKKSRKNWHEENE